MQLLILGVMSLSWGIYFIEELKMADVALRKKATEMRYYDDCPDREGLSVQAFFPDRPDQGRIFFNFGIKEAVKKMWVPNVEDPFCLVEYKEVIIGRGDSAEKISWKDFAFQLRAGKTPRVEAISTDSVVAVSPELIDYVKQERAGWERIKELIESL